MAKEQRYLAEPVSNVQGRELELFVDRLRELHRVGQALASASDKAELLRHAFEFLTNSLSYRAASIGLEPECSRSNTPHFTVPIRLGSEVIGNIRIPLKRGQSISGMDSEILHCLAGFLSVGLGNIKRLEALNALATTDPLTGIMNRRQLLELGTNRASAAKCTSVIVFDIDHFKGINDAFGHDVGDAVLQFVVARARENIRETDLLARLGGDEFLILLPDTRIETALLIAERIRTNIHCSAVRMKGRLIGSTISAGLACVKGVLDLTHLIGLGDQALYAAKQAGRNSVYFHRVRQGSATLLKYPRN